MSHTFRLATEADLEAINSIDRAAGPYMDKGIYELSDMVEDKQFLLAVSGDKVIGFAHLEFSPIESRANIANFVVLPEHRSQDMAAYQFFHHVKDYCIGLGYQKLSADGLSADATKVSRFVGFKDVSETDRFEMKLPDAPKKPGSGKRTR